MELAGAIAGLLGAAELVIKNREAAHRALARYQAAADGDFADALILQIAALAGVSATVSFDQRICAASGMRLLPPRADLRLPPALHSPRFRARSAQRFAPA